MNVLRKTGKMLRHDCSVGLRQGAWVCPLLVLYLVSACVLFDRKFSRWAAVQAAPEQQPGLTDYFADLFQGIEPYRFSLQNGFRLPAVWMMFFILFLLSIAKYPRGDLYGIGQQLLLKSGSRTAWWAAKAVWVAVCAAGYCAVSFLTVFVYAALAHGPRWQASSFTAAVLPGLAALSPVGTFLWLAGVPFLTLCALGSLALLVGLFAAPVVGVVAGTAALLAALYFNLSALPGGTCILLRSSLAAADGFSLGRALAAPAIVFFLCSFAGGLLFQHLDLHKNREGQ